MGNYIYYGYTSVRRTVTSEPTVKKVDTVVEVSRPCCEIETIEKVISNTAHIVKVEQKVEEKKVEVKEVKEIKKEVEEVEEVKEEVKVEEVKEEVKVEEVNEVKEDKVEEVNDAKEVKVEEVKEVKEVDEKIVIDLKIAKAKSPLLPPIKEESMDVHPYLLEYGTAPIKSNTILIQNQTYQKKKNKKRD